MLSEYIKKSTIDTNLIKLTHAMDYVRGEFSVWRDIKTGKLLYCSESYLDTAENERAFEAYLRKLKLVKNKGSSWLQDYSIEPFGWERARRAFLFSTRGERSNVGRPNVNLSGRRVR